MNTNKDNLLEKIKSLSPLSDQKKWADCKMMVEILNIHDEKNKEILEEAKRKGL